MNIFRFPQIHIAYNSYDKTIRYAFCSKRLANLMLEKSRDGDWVYPYFSTGQNKLFNGFVTHCVSNHGLLIFVIEKNK